MLPDMPLEGELLTVRDRFALVSDNGPDPHVEVLALRPAIHPFDFEMTFPGWPLAVTTWSPTFASPACVERLHRAGKTAPLSDFCSGAPRSMSRPSARDLSMKARLKALERFLGRGRRASGP
jgi:hypothetical protein